MLTNTIYGHSDTVKSLAFNPNTDNSIPVLASAGDYTVLLSDPRPTQKAELLSLSPHTAGKEVEAVSISPDGSLLVSGGRDGLLALLTLSIPSLQTQNHNDSVSTHLRNSRTILEQSFDKDSTEDLVEAVSQASTSEGDLSVAASRENVSQGSYESLKREHFKQQNHLAMTTEKEQHRKAQSARVSRQKRAEKKVVDLPSMIAHLSASVRGSVLETQHNSSSSSGGSSDSEEEEETDAQEVISNLIGITQKVNKFSQIASAQESERKVPGPRLSLLPEDVPETIKENRRFFESREALEGIDGHGEYRNDSPAETEYYDGYSSLLPGEDSDDEDDSSPMQSGHYTLGSLTGHSSRQHSYAEELGSTDEDVPFSMI